MLIHAQDISYTLPTGQSLFQDIYFSLHKNEKAAIVGNNGAGKSTLLRIIAGQETAYSGTIHVSKRLYYVPQHFGHFDHLSVAAACGIAPLLEALQAIENGDTRQELYDLLENDWDIAARYQTAFEKWGIGALSPDQLLSTLSGGQKTRLFLSGIDIFQPQVVLLDEPTNHLDRAAREQLYEWVNSTNCTLLLVSHDRELLRLCNPIWELQANGINVYGGSYDFYVEQKAIAAAAKEQQLAHQEKTLKEAKKQQQIALERKQHADARARKNSQQGGLPKILLNARRNAGETSTAKLQQVHAEKVSELHDARKEAAALIQVQRMLKGYFEDSSLHRGKVLLTATSLNYAWTPDKVLWQPPLSFTIRSGERWSITGPNGSGKSTLMRLLLGHIVVPAMQLYRADTKSLLLDQDYSLVDRSKTVLDQALAFNERKLDTPIVKSTLVNFLFGPDTWDKSCAVLSGGEMLRLSLCCMTLQNRAPDLIMLDEPTNNLDLNNIQVLTQIFADYKGTLIVISHDNTFIKETGMTHHLELRASGEWAMV
ncbi:ABC-F family ATP-binding cassette domain-containing protein [Chitinophaga sp. Ak27]|uniref:ABC-F family ATP-binding cassette domain-containing protein n=1 Tax=Chitinophaga sp. Ak27 TaxID=2726116 RepID=UPI00145D336D|nr:ABC-F family ATP-binding cassette domain-containing protein [Chitinophaga sp. Ak27]NLU93457.1 ABC-F family ATP-binding cassette domain-containing protein [Chitinophaga sp. Ak27]